MKILVTGVNGFAGKHLVRRLNQDGHQVIGLGHSKVHGEIEKLLTGYINCDLTSKQQVKGLDLRSLDAVISLAGLIKKKDSNQTDDDFNSINVSVFSNLGEHLLELNSKARVIAVSTSLVYDQSQPLPFDEESTTITNALPYAKSKLLMEDSANELREAGLDCIVVRPFNHTGPGQATGYLIPDIYYKLQQYKMTGASVMVGPKDTRRDYTDVRDVVKAYADLATAKTLDYKTYNICSGTSRSFSDILTTIEAAMGIEGAPLEINRDYARPNDALELYGSSLRIYTEFGWKPTIAFEQTIKDFVDHMT